MHIEEIIDSIPPLTVYLVVGVVIGVESLGVPLPGEVVLVSAALLSARSDLVSPLWVGAGATVGAIAGDSAGYLIGQRGGPRLFAWAGRRFPKHFGPAVLDRARGVFDKRGAWAVFLGRFVALLRILFGPLAGSLHMPYGRFLAANALGGLVWAGGTTLLVYSVGTAAEKWLKGFSWVGLAVAVVAGVVVTVVIKRRVGHGSEEPPAGRV